MTVPAVDAFAPAALHRVAAILDADAIHVWWLPYRREQGRAPLKALLAAYLDTRPDAVRLADGEHGRPALASPHDLDFNWSHSGQHALIAVARDLSEIGVDIERQRPHPRALALAERFFAASEYAWLTSLPEAERNEAFIRLWTAKEAVLKAHGRGLAYGLERVVFTGGEDEIKPRQFQGDVGAADQWQLRRLQPAPTLHASLAWRGPARPVRRFKICDA